MPAFRGRLLLIRVSNGASPESFTTISGMRSKTVRLNNSPVDITDNDTAPWRTLLADAGLRSVTVSGSAVFQDDAAFATVQDLASRGAIEDFRIEFPNGDVFQGGFQVTDLTREAAHDGEESWSMTLESASLINIVTV